LTVAASRERPGGVAKNELNLIIYQHFSTIFYPITFFLPC